MVILVCICIFNTVMIVKIKKDYIYKIRNKLLEKQLEEEKKLQDKVANMYDEGRILSHDLKHYLIIITDLLKRGEYEKAQERMSVIAGKYIDNSHITYTNCGMVNAIINEKQTKCEYNDINFNCKVTGSLLEENEMNVAIILSNILDNAIEAQQNCAKKIVNLEMYQNKGMYNITVSNNIKNSVLQTNPELLTSKRNKMCHGFGLKSANMLVKEMDGCMDYYEDRGQFVVEISFPMIRENIY